jgi:hypothetical protein
METTFWRTLIDSEEMLQRYAFKEQVKQFTSLKDTAIRILYKSIRINGSARSTDTFRDVN